MKFKTRLSSVPGAGRVVEMNIFTGQRGITANTPFSPANVGTPICPDGGAARRLS